MSESTNGKAYDTKSYLEWVINERACWGQYHRHKETMAWVATALYIPGIIVLGYHVPDMTACWQYLVVFVVFALVACLILKFAKMQFNNHWDAHYIVAGLIRAASRLSSGKPPLDGSDLIVGKDKRWPEFIEKEIKHARESKENVIIPCE